MVVVVAGFIVIVCLQPTDRRPVERQTDRPTGARVVWFAYSRGQTTKSELLLLLFLLLVYFKSNYAPPKEQAAGREFIKGRPHKQSRLAREKNATD